MTDEYAGLVLALCAVPHAEFGSSVWWEVRGNRYRFSMTGHLYGDFGRNLHCNIEALRRFGLVKLVASDERDTVIDVYPTQAGHELITELALDVDLALISGEDEDA